MYSGLNGLKPADNETQLSTYYHWGIKKELEPLCMVVAPNFRASEISREIAEKDPTMVTTARLLIFLLMNIVQETYQLLTHIMD